jgi:hypothetical protein
MIIRSNRWKLCYRFRNYLKSTLSTDSGVTSIILASLGGRRLSYSTHEILSV